MARKRIHTRVLGQGTWTVRDEVLGYRICNCYQESKYPDHPSHIHDPWDRVVASCPIRSPHEAANVMIAYHQHHTSFDLSRFQTEIERHADPHHP